MIVYQSTKLGFSSDVRNNLIEQKIADVFLNNLKKHPNPSEVTAWRNSMMYMDNVLQDSVIPDDCGVMIEYQIPQMMKRIDFILTGKNGAGLPQVVIVELKQWTDAQATDMHGIVLTALGGGIRETNHPSYQAWSYAQTIMDYNSAAESNDVQFSPCAYLHNMLQGDAIRSEFYKEYTDKAPLFLRAEVNELRDFIAQFVTKGDKGRIMEEIEQGDIRPSKSLADALKKMLKGAQEFIMLDEQKVVFEKVMKVAQSHDETKKVIIAEGGPGTGKSVVAINLLVELTAKGLKVKYVSKNAAPRAVYRFQLQGEMRQVDIAALFTGSGSFTDSKPNEFDVLLVDEAHRLNEKSGMYKNMGENQIKELINAARTTVFFLDEDQKVTMSDIGDKEEIQKWVSSHKASLYTYTLDSQFRCNGSDGYISWLDNALQIRGTANESLQGMNYDFQVFDDPNELRKAVVAKNSGNKARLVAGYCWDWVSRNDRSKNDIVLGDGSFKMNWNLSEDGSLWILKPTSINEIGCIHTCQGLEVDYVGVIVGDDLIARNGEVLVNPAKRAKTDSALKGYKKLMETTPEETKARVKALIKNTYRTLMTRGSKGCYVYFTDRETADYFRNSI